MALKSLSRIACVCVCLLVEASKVDATPDCTLDADDGDSSCHLVGSALLQVQRSDMNKNVASEEVAGTETESRSHTGEGVRLTTHETAADDDGPNMAAKDLCGRIAAGKTMALFADGGPSNQAAVDLFSTDYKWVTTFPSEIGAHSEGAYFDGWKDDRLHYFFEHFNVTDKVGLELGPLEGAHSYMLQKAGVAKVDAIEGDAAHFMKCLVMKNMADLTKVHFHFGDFRAFASAPQNYAQLGLRTRYDFAVAVGVLYHMENPVQLLYDLAVTLRVPHLLIWTQVYSDLPGEHQQKQRGAFGLAGPPGNELPLDEARSVGGWQHTLHKHFYATEGKKFLGGAQPFANWLTKEDLIGALTHFGMHVKVNEALSGPGPNGMQVTLLAQRNEDSA